MVDGDEQTLMSQNRHALSAWLDPVLFTLA